MVLWKMRGNGEFVVGPTRRGALGLLVRRCLAAPIMGARLFDAANSAPTRLNYNVHFHIRAKAVPRYVKGSFVILNFGRRGCSELFSSLPDATRPHVTSLGLRSKG